MSKIDQKILDKLSTFDTPTICNIVELFQIRPRSTGFMDARIQACFPEMPPVVGFAATATFRAGGPPRQQDAYASTELQVERFEELSGPPIVVFQDLDNPTVAATFGEVMCTTYQVFGAVGLITSGAGRDLEQVRALNFAVFTSGTISAHGFCHILQTHVPVHVGGLVIYPDDLLHGDLNGVTTIPLEIASEVASIGDEFVAAEQIILDALHTENPSLKLLREATAAAKARIDELSNEVSRAHS